MPERTKKDHKCSHHTEGSRWHRFHFSGKVIMCSVLLGLMLVLIGGILMATSMDNEDETKSGDFNDIQKKPPTIYVGPAIMGIGGFAVIVGVLMCLFETNVCRKRTADTNPLITTDTAENGRKDSEPTSVPSTSHHREKHRHGNRKHSPSPRHKHSPKKPPKGKNQMEASLSSSQSSVSPPAFENANASKNFLTASDKFLTPPNSFPPDTVMNVQDYNQNQASLMQSFTSSGKSWSGDFQTPAASFRDDPISLQFTDRRDEMSLNIPKSDIVPNQNHKFLTPKNSDAETSMATNIDETKREDRKEEVLAVLSEKKEHLAFQTNIPEKLNFSDEDMNVQRMDCGKNDEKQLSSKTVSPISDNPENISDKDLNKSFSDKNINSTEKVESKNTNNAREFSSEISSGSDLKENGNTICSGNIESDVMSYEGQISEAVPDIHDAQEPRHAKNNTEDKSEMNETVSNLNNIKEDGEEISVLRTDSNNEISKEMT